MKFVEPLYDTLTGMWIGLVKVLPLLAIAVIVLFLTWALIRIGRRLLLASLKKSRFRPSLQQLLTTMLQTVLWILGILIAVTVVFPSLTPAKLLAALGLGSVAVGLAFKDVFENFFAGVLIMLREPMRIGDFISCEGVEGRVEHISIRETYLRQTDDQLILVPNSFLFKNPLYIRTDKPLRRFEVIVGVAYGEDIPAAAKVIKRAVSCLEFVSGEKPAEVYAREFNSSSVDFTVRWWAESKPIDLHTSRSEVVIAIKGALDEAGIEIPFPYRTLTFKEPLNIADPGQQGG